MDTAYDGRQVVGMDLHRRRSVLVRMTEDARKLGTARITNSPAELRAAIACAGAAAAATRAPIRSTRLAHPARYGRPSVVSSVPPCLLWRTASTRTRLE